MPVIGLQKMGSIFKLSVLDDVHLGLSFSLRSTGCLGLVMLVLDLLHLDFSLPLHSWVRIESTIFALQVARFGLFSSLLDRSTLGSFLPMQSSAYLDLILLTLDFSHHDLSLPMRSHL